MTLTNWLQQIFSRTTSSRIRGARALARRHERALAHSQRWLDRLETRTLLTTVLIDYSLDTNNFFDTQGPLINSLQNQNFAGGVSQHRLGD